MPRRPLDKYRADIVPEWVRSLQDECLRKMLIEAFFTRFKAVDAGAYRYRRTQEALLAGDATMEQIEYGRYQGPAACEKAAVVLRKYTNALDDAEVKHSAHGRYHG